MTTHRPAPATNRRGRARDGGPGAVPRPSARSKVFPVPPPPVPLHVRLWRQINGDEGAGFALSFVVHVILLAIFSIPVVRHLRHEEGYTTLVQDAFEEQVVFDDPVDTSIPLPEVDSSAGDALQSKLLDPLSHESEMTIPEVKLADSTSLEGDSSSGREGSGASGVRIAEPKNAIRAGNFSVWPWPLQPFKVDGKEVHGKPGEFPKVSQDYSIVIRIKVPDDRRTVGLHEFSGTVVGTDGYQQKIPQDAWYFNTKGDLVRARSGRRLPVIEGTVELLIRVPGAASAQVKDTIEVHSRTLDETQTIELVFQSRDR